MFIRLLNVCGIETPKDGLQMKFSLRGTVAMTLLGWPTGDVNYYSDTNAQNLDYQKLLTRFEIVEATELKTMETRLSLKLKDGGTLETFADSSKPNQDLAQQQTMLEQKFKALSSSLTEAQLLQALARFSLAS